MVRDRRGGLFDQATYAKNGAEKRFKEYIARWKEGLEDGMKGATSISSHIRRYLFEKFKSACTRCGWSERHPITNNVPLEVEHLDGDFRNNVESNLTLLCPNCHALTSTYRALNRGRGRPRVVPSRAQTGLENLGVGNDDGSIPSLPANK